MIRSLPTARLRLKGVHHAMRDIGDEFTVCGLRPVKSMPAGIYPVGCKHCLRVLGMDAQPSEPEMRCPGCDCEPVGYAPHNGKGDCPPRSSVLYPKEEPT